jgi:hypothetical protein
MSTRFTQPMYGPPKEQVLMRVGWQRKALTKEKQCQTCRHYELRFDRTPKGKER